MKARKRDAIFLFAALVIPLDDAGKWQMEKYSNIPTNAVTFSEGKMLIQIKRSASPLIFSFSQIQKVTGFRVKGEFRGLPKIKEVTKQGEKGGDDYPLRMGFVVPGEKNLTGLKRLLAPAWIKNLYSRVPPGSGVDRIEFFNVTQNPRQVGGSRVHPLSDLIYENFFALVDHEGKFDFAYSLKEPLMAAALWVSIDGDDTKSDYEVLITRIELITS